MFHRFTLTFLVVSVKFRIQRIPCSTPTAANNLKTKKKNKVPDYKVTSSHLEVGQ